VVSRERKCRRLKLRFSATADQIFDQ
jgi:hypothetical protein